MDFPLLLPLATSFSLPLPLIPTVLPTPASSSSLPLPTSLVNPRLVFGLPVSPSPTPTLFALALVFSFCSANERVDNVVSFLIPVPVDAADSLFGGRPKVKFVAPFERVIPGPDDVDDVLVPDETMPIVDAGGRDVVLAFPGVFPGVVGGSVFATELSVGRVTDERDIARLRAGVFGRAASV